MESVMKLCRAVLHCFGVVLATGLAALSGCTGLQLAGSVSETTNGGVVGVIVDQKGAPAGRTRVVLLRADYDPVKGSTVATVDTTDSLGEVCLLIRCTEASTMSSRQYKLTTAQNPWSSRGPCR